jgi:hypothetical protein
VTPTLLSALACMGLLVGFSATCGNWDQRPIGHRALVLVVAVDPGRGPSDGRYTFGVANLNALASSGGGAVAGSSGSPQLSVTVDAPTLSDALTRAQQSVAGEIYLGQLSAVVLSERLSARQVADVVEGLVDRPDVDGAQYLMAAQDAAAAANGPAPSARLPTDALTLMVTCVGCEPVFHPMQLWQAYADLRCSLASMVLPEVAAGATGPRWTGLALYSGSRYAYSVRGTDAVAFGILRGWTRRGNFTFAAPGGLSFTAIDVAADSRLGYTLRRGRLTVREVIRLSGRRGDVQAQRTPVATESPSPSVTAAFARAALERCAAVWRRAAGQGLDALDVGGLVAGQGNQFLVGQRPWNEIVRHARLKITLTANLDNPVPTA